MKTHIIFLMFGIVGTILGAFFKIMHWPGSMGILLASFTFIIWGAVMAVLKKKK